MKDNRETISVQLVPMAQEDRDTIRDAMLYLQSFWTLLGQDDWRGGETIMGLRRIGERISDYSHPFEIPMPMSKRAPEEALFVDDPKDRRR